MRERRRFSRTVKVRNFEVSSHAELRIRERGIDLIHVKNAILQPTKKRQQYKGEHGGIVWKMSKTIDGKNLAVVAELYKENCYIVSAFYED
jgi:dihydroorotate dehydrogenase